MFIKTTRHIKVAAIPMYLAQQSDPGEGHYVWAYTILIQNLGAATVKLLNRTWNITDGNGQMQEVHGPGVVGEQPVLPPGEKFQYSSGSVLPTPSGLMAGNYEMLDMGTGEHFSVEIPAFSLDSPAQKVRPN